MLVRMFNDCSYRSTTINVNLQCHETIKQDALLHQIFSFGVPEITQPHVLLLHDETKATMCSSCYCPLMLPCHVQYEWALLEVMCFIVVVYQDCITTRVVFEQIINTLRPRWNSRHFQDDVVKWVFLNEKVWISIRIALKFVPKLPIDDKQHWFRKWLGVYCLNQWWAILLSHIYITRP